LTPLNPDISRQLRALFDAHDEAFRALRVANTEMGTANAAMGHAIQAHDDAIQAALAANRAALELLERLSGNGQQG
jgi:hypothetical protein